MTALTSLGSALIGIGSSLGSAHGDRRIGIGASPLARLRVLRGGVDLARRAADGGCAAGPILLIGPRRGAPGRGRLVAARRGASNCAELQSAPMALPVQPSAASDQPSASMRDKCLIPATARCGPLTERFPKGLGFLPHVPPLRHRAVEMAPSCATSCNPRTTSHADGSRPLGPSPDGCRMRRRPQCSRNGLRLPGGALIGLASAERRCESAAAARRA